MFRLLIVFIVIASLALALWFVLAGRPRGEANRFPGDSFKIESPAFNQGEMIPAVYTCDGGNISPPLQISGVPAAAQTLALIMEDPDAPLGVFTHWTVWNIPAGVREIQSRSLPEGAIEGRTDFGVEGYSGPCPPTGSHRYVFKLYALDSAVPLSPGSRKVDLLRAVEGKVIAQAELVGVYQRR